MKKPLWEPSEECKNQANITCFIGLVNEKYGLDIDSYTQLWDWSVENIPDFWATMWEFGEIQASRGYDEVVDDAASSHDVAAASLTSKFPGAKWFGGARLNFAENLLRHRDDQVAFIFRGETQKSATMTYAELYDTVARLAKSLREIGVVPGDRVVGYMPNLMETAIAMLAATSVGATWASCATDIGSQAALDRLGQVKPRVLFTADGTFIRASSSTPWETLRKLRKEFLPWRRLLWCLTRQRTPTLAPSPKPSTLRISWPGKTTSPFNSSNCLSIIPCTSCFPPGPPASLSVWCRELGES